MTELRLTLTDTGLIVHDGLYQRDPSVDEAAQIRDALDSPGMPWWFDAAAVLLGIAALVLVFGPRAA